MDPIAQNVDGVQQLVSSKLNKIPFSSSQDEGASSEHEDVLTLKLSDEELLALAKKYTTDYQLYEGKLTPRQEANKTYYLGLQKEGTSAGANGPISANLLFEAEETFLPAALSKNPEPVVWADNTPEGSHLSDSVKTMLQYHADVLCLRRSLTLMTRHWSIYFIGIIKHGWDDTVKDIVSEVRKPQNFVFDPEGHVDVFGDFTSWLGERIEVTGEKLIDMFPKHSAYITEKVKGKLGTKVTYTEWWSGNDEFCFYTFGDKVLDKSKNPYWNYEQEPQIDEVTGEAIEPEVKLRNHFGKPKKPYTFLTVFSLGEQPHDITGLIEQNIPNQRRVSRRTEQMDYNLSRSNNSDVFSANNFNEETAKQAANALAKGNPILVPQGGPIAEAIHRLQAPTIGAEFFNDLEVSKMDLRQIFGTQGITPNPSNPDKTVRGRLVSQQQDVSRLGGGIGDAIEQVACRIFDWWTQLYHVYYDEPHYAAILGKSKAIEYITLSQQDLDRRLVVSVSPDSMKPKDEMTEMNQAMELWNMGVIDPKTLLTMLNIPDPEGVAESAVLWMLDKQAYMQLNFPDLAEKMAMMQAQAQQAQMAMGGGQQVNPEQAIQQEKQSESLSADPASSELNQVPINNLATPTL